MPVTNVKEIDLNAITLREANQALQSLNGGKGTGAFRIVNPLGSHALACGLDAPLNVDIDGHVGYFCAGMNKSANIVIDGNAGQGVAENMMSGKVIVEGDAS